MSELLHDLRFALRSARRRPGFTALVVLTLALGLGVNVAVFSLVQALLLRPLPFPDADRLVRVLAFKGSEPGRLAQREIQDLQRESKAFEVVAAYYLSQYNVTGEGPPAVVPTAIASHQIFEVLGARFALGGPFAAEQDFYRQYRVVLSHHFWQRRFGGDPDILGSSIVLDGGSYVVDGVLEAASEFPPGVELYRQVTEYHGLDGRRHSVLARLRPEASLEQARQELERFGQTWQERHPELNRGVHFEAIPLRDSWVGAARPFLLTLGAAVAFVLLIAIVNTINLLLARAGERRDEMAVRVSLGADHLRLVRQLLAESLLPAVLGGGLGLLLAIALLRFFTSFVDADLPSWMEVRLDPVVLGVAAALTLASAVLAGLAPAFAASRIALGPSRSGTRGTADRSAAGLRNTLVMAEIALALVLLVGAGLMVRSMAALDRQDLGFEAEDLFTVRVDPPYWSYQKIEQTTPFYERALANLAQLPGVRGVAANQNLPLAGLDENTKRVVTLGGQAMSEQESNPFIHLQSVSPGYFEVMGIPLRQGRDFTPDDRQETLPVAVVSQRLAERLWPGEALEKRLKLGPPESETPWMTVVGIVGDVRSERRSGEVSLDLYVSHFQHFTGDTYFALRTSLDGSQFLRQVEAAIQNADPDLPLFDVMPMQQRVARVEWQRQATSRLFSVFGLLALALAAFGTYGVISYQVVQRTHEMGVRQALGARPKDLVTQVVRQGLGLFLRGSVLGWLAALALIRWLDSILFGVAATDPPSLAAAWLTLLLALLLACLLPAYKVAKLDPLLAIRGDRE